MKIVCGTFVFPPSNLNISFFGDVFVYIGLLWLMVQNKIDEHSMSDYLSIHFNLMHLVL